MFVLSGSRVPVLAPPMGEAAMGLQESARTATKSSHAEKILKVYSNNNPNFVFKKLEGGHHVHLNEPEKVAPLINSFLKKQFKDSGTEDKQNIPFN